MKTFIVFLAIMLVNISFLSFHSDMIRYGRLQVSLKAVAEECAAGGALYREDESFRQGRLVISQREAEEFASALVGETEKKLPETMEGKITVDLELFDDENGIPSLRASVHLKCNDLFRLPFLTLTHVKRSAVYQWENRYGNSLTNES